MNPTADKKAKIARIVSLFKEKRILVLGDLMLDKYIWGDVSRISPEAPVPVVEVRRSSTALGGAGNVAQNLLSLGASPVIAGIVGDDEEGRWIQEHAGEPGGIFVDRSRPTTVKTRIIAHHQQVVRVDFEKKSALPARLEEKFLGFIWRGRYDGLIISDYNKGMVSASLMEKVLSLARKRHIPVFVDPKMEHLRLFSPVTLITVNHFEAEKIVQHECRTDSQVEKAGHKILSLIACRYLIVKRGERGMTVFEKEINPRHIPAVAKDVFDVTGAGDTVIATVSLALLAGTPIEMAAAIANAAAGIVVGKIGAAAVSPRELLAALTR